MEGTADTDAPCSREKESLLRKYALPVSHLDFLYVETCTNGRELEKILHVLQSGQEGHYPDLIRKTEERLKQIKPNSRYIRKMTPVIDIKQLNQEEQDTLTSDFSSWLDDVCKASDELHKVRKKTKGTDLPEVRKSNTSLENVTGKEVKRIKSTDYSSWDKYDPDTELLKMDIEVERLRKDIEAKERQEKAATVASFSKNLTETEAVYAAEREREKGNEFFKAGEYNQAIIHYTNSINYKPSAKNYNNRAIAKIKLDNYDTAISDCKAVLKYEPNNIKALLRLVQCYDSLKQYDVAITICQRIIWLDPNNTGAQYFINKLHRTSRVKQPNEKTRMKIIEVADKSPKKSKSITFNQIERKQGKQREPDLSKRPGKSILKKKEVLLPIPGPSSMTEPYYVVVENKDPEIIKRQEFILNSRSQLLYLTNIDSSTDDNECLEVHNKSSRENVYKYKNGACNNDTVLQATNDCVKENINTNTNNNKNNATVEEITKEENRKSIAYGHPKETYSKENTNGDKRKAMEDGIKTKFNTEETQPIPADTKSNFEGIKTAETFPNDDKHKFKEIKIEEPCLNKNIEESNNKIQDTCTKYEKTEANIQQPETFLHEVINIEEFFLNNTTGCNSEIMEHKEYNNETKVKIEESFENEAEQRNNKLEEIYLSNNSKRENGKAMQANNTSEVKIQEISVKKYVQKINQIQDNMVCDNKTKVQIEEIFENEDEKRNNKIEEIYLSNNSKEEKEISEIQEISMEKCMQEGKGTEESFARDFEDLECSNADTRNNTKSLYDGNAAPEEIIKVEPTRPKLNLIQNGTLKKPNSFDTIPSTSIAEVKPIKRSPDDHIMIDMDGSDPSNYFYKCRRHQSLWNLNMQKYYSDYSCYDTNKNDYYKPAEKDIPWKYLQSDPEGNWTKNTTMSQFNQACSTDSELTCCLQDADVIDRYQHDCRKACCLHTTNMIKRYNGECCVDNRTTCCIHNPDNSKLLSKKCPSNVSCCIHNSEVNVNNRKEAVQENSNESHHQDVQSIDNQRMEESREEQSSNIIQYGDQYEINDEEVNSPYSFLRTWSSIGLDPMYNKHADILKILDYNRISSVIGYKLDGTMLSKIISTLYIHFMVPHEIDRVYSILNNLSGMGRFNLVSMFLTAEDRLRVKCLFQFLQMHGKPLSENIQRLYN